MTKVDLQYDLINYTPASASPVQANFSRTEQHINQELIERDGTVAMRAQLKLVGDPVAELDAAPKQYVDAVLPVGIIMMYGGTAVPPGGRWAICNGAELETATWPELFAVLGNAYSLPGVPAGRFNLPNLADRFPRGGTPGAQGGSADQVVVKHTHRLGFQTGVQRQPHNHISPDHLHSAGQLSTAGATVRHTHNGPDITVYQYTGAPQFYIAVTGGGLTPAAMFNLNQIGTSTDLQDHGHNVQGYTGAADRGLTTGNEQQSHDHDVNGTTAEPDGSVAGTNANLPPYVGVTYIIRVN